MMDMHDFWLEPGDADFIPGGRARFNRDIDRRIAVVEIGRNVCFGGGKGGGGSSPKPDPRIGEAAVMNAEIGKEWLTFAKDQFDEGNKRLEVMDALTGKVINQQLDTQARADQWAQADRARYEDTFIPLQDEYIQQARDDRERYKTVFEPLQDEFIDYAKNYATPERISAESERAAAEAGADVQKAGDVQRQANARTMASMGLNPLSGRFQAMTRSEDLNAGLARGGASNAARTATRERIEDKGIALKTAAINMGTGLNSTLPSAINMGSGLPASTIASSGLGLNAGNAAVGNQGASDAGFYKNTGIMGQGFAGAQQGYANQANIMNNLYGNQLQGWAANQQAKASESAGFGQILGTGIGAFAAL